MSIKPEMLLAHTDFVRYLARSLILDENLADDVAQDALVAAIERPPQTAEALTAWLRTVTRNFALALKRERKRRETREQGAARRERVPSPADVLERESVRNRVVEAVLDLDETYRDPILLRYYENLPPREIAGRLDLPVETVRTRLRRGLERLRSRLDENFDGNRSSWCMALAPVAGIKAGDAAAAASSGPVSAAAAGSMAATAGMAALSAKLKVAGAAALLAGIALLGGNLLIPDRNPEPAGGPRHDAGIHRGTTAAGEGIPAREQRGAYAETAASPGDGDLEEMTPTGTVLSGRVRDMITREPVRPFHFELIRTSLTAPDSAYSLEESVIQDWVDDEEGRFSYSVEREGSYQIKVHSSSHRVFETYCVQASEGGGALNLLVELDPGRAITGRVIDADSGRPVEGVLIGPQADRVTGMLFTKPELYGQPPKGIHTRTDGEGRFTLKGLPPGRQEMIARHPDYAEETFESGPDGSLDLIRLRSGFRVFGRAYPGRGPVIVWVNRRPCMTDENGAYRSAPVPPGKTLVAVESNTGPEAPFGVFKPGQHYWKVDRSVVVHDRDLEIDFGLDEDTVTWQGTFYRRRSPVAGGRIMIHHVGRDRYGAKTHLRYSVPTDPEGRFAFLDLPVGEYRTSLKIPDPQRVIKADSVFLERPGRIERDIRLNGGRISGVVVNQDTGQPLTTGRVDLNAAAAGEYGTGALWFSRLDDMGRFSLEGLRPGAYFFGSVGFHILGIERLDALMPTDRGLRVTIQEDEAFDHVIISASSTWAFIHLTIRGFEEEGPNRILPSFRLAGGRSFADQQQCWELLSNGTLERFFRTPPLAGRSARCMMDLSAGKQVLTRTFEVRPNRVTELRLNRADFRTDHGLLAVTGSFHRSGGAPVKGVRLRFHQEELAWKNKAGFTCTTDADGRFSLEGLLLPGKVRIEALMGDESRLSLPWTIPEDPSGAIHLPLTIPDPSALSFVLYDGRTGAPCRFGFDAKAGATIELIGPEGRQWTTKQWSLEDGRFHLERVPAGSYRLAIRVRGYLPGRIESLSLSAGQALDLGAIRLDPSSFLVLDLIDGSGKAVGGAPGVTFSREVMEQEDSRYELPPGTVRFKVSLPGFKEAESTVELEAGKTTTRRIRMETF